MKYLRFLILLILAFSCTKENTNDSEVTTSDNLQDFKINHLELTDTILINNIIEYKVNFHNELNKGGVLVLKYVDSNKGSEYYISHVIYKSSIEQYPPLGYVILNDNYVLVYTGFERDLKIDNESLQELLNRLSGDLIDDKQDDSESDDLFIPMSYDPPILKVNIDYDSVYSEVVGQNPY